MFCVQCIPAGLFVLYPLCVVLISDLVVLSFVQIPIPRFWNYSNCRSRLRVRPKAVRADWNATAYILSGFLPSHLQTVLSAPPSHILLIHMALRSYSCCPSSLVITHTGLTPPTLHTLYYKVTHTSLNISLPSRLRYFSVDHPLFGPFPQHYHINLTGVYNKITTTDK